MGESEHSSSETTSTSTSTSTSTMESDGVKVKVGGKVLETTRSTLQSTESPTTNPEQLSSILSLRRTHKQKQQYMISESRWYPFVSPPPPPPFSPFDACLVTSLIPPSSPLVSAFSACNSPILLAHSGQVSCYHPVTLSLDSCFRTHVDHISSVASISDEVVLAVGSHSSSGLHVYATTTGLHLGSVFWVDHSDTRLDKSRVSAIACPHPHGPLFSAAFHSHHGENAVLLIDNHTLKVVSEIGRQSGNSAKSSAITKMRWVPTLGLLVGTSINSGAFGYSGYVRLWDPRSRNMVWDTHEPGGGLTLSRRLGDTMADVDVDPHRLFLAKVGSNSGDLGVADLRKLGPDPWLYLEDPNPGFSANWKPGSTVVLHCYQGNVFVSTDGELQAWSTMEHTTWPMYRRIFVDKLHHSHRGIITNIQGGAPNNNNTLFLTRLNVEGVELWQTSPSSGLHTLV